MKTSSGLLVAAGLGTACGKGVDVSVTGTVEVHIAGLGSGLADGGSALVTRTDLPGFTPVTIPLPASGQGSADVPAGTYNAVYTPPAGYQVSGTNSFNVTITAGQTTVVNVTVGAIATSGTLRVFVSGLTGASSGGSAALLRTDITGQTAINVPIPASGGPVDTVVAVGTYQVTYTTPAGFNLNSGVINPQNAAVADGGTSTVTFAVTAVASSGTPDIYSHDFEDGTTGLFINSSTQQNIAPWAIDNTTAKCGGKSIKLDYAASAGNVGSPFFFQLSPPRTSYYVRFAYKQSVPFNSNGSHSNSDQAKIQRGLGPGFNAQRGSFFIGIGNFSNGNPSFGWDSENPGLGNRVANLNLPAPNMNNFLGQWVVVENFWDISTPGQGNFKCWINGTQHFDYTDPIASTGADTYAYLQFDGTINSMASASTAWFDEIGVSSKQMGVPC